MLMSMELKKKKDNIDDFEVMALLRGRITIYGDAVLRKAVMKCHVRRQHANTVLVYSRSWWVAQ